MSKRSNSGDTPKHKDLNVIQATRQKEQEKVFTYQLCGLWVKKDYDEYD